MSDGLGGFPGEQPLAPPEPASEQVQPSSYGAVLRNPDFRRLWTSQFVSGIGDWLVIGFLIPLVGTLSGNSSFAVAGILIAKILPSLLLSSFVGALVDRLDRRKVMIAADLTRAVLCLLLLATQMLAPGAALTVIYLTVFLMEVASLFFVPAKNALIPALVSEDEVATANALSYTTQQASMLVGLTASGTILAAFEWLVRVLVGANLPLLSQSVSVLSLALIGPYAGVFLDSLTFVVSAAAIGGIHVVKRNGQDEYGGLDLSLIGSDAIDSFRFIQQHAELRGLLVTIGLAILGGGALVPVGLTYVKENLISGGLVSRVPALQKLAGTPQTFMLVFLALGMVAGALVVPRVERRFRLQLLFAGAVAAFGGAMLVFALVQTYWLAGLCTLVAGLALATVTVTGNTYVIRTTSDELRGRVFAALESVIRVSLLLSMLIMAPLRDIANRFIVSWVVKSGLTPADVRVTGSRITLVLASLVVIAAALYGFKTLQWRSCEDEEPILARERALDG